MSSTVHIFSSEDPYVAVSVLGRLQYNVKPRSAIISAIREIMLLRVLRRQTRSEGELKDVRREGLEEDGRYNNRENGLWDVLLRGRFHLADCVRLLPFSHLLLPVALLSLQYEDPLLAVLRGYSKWTHWVRSRESPVEGGRSVVESTVSEWLTKRRRTDFSIGEEEAVHRSRADLAGALSELQDEGERFLRYL